MGGKGVARAAGFSLCMAYGCRQQCAGRSYRGSEESVFAIAAARSRTARFESQQPTGTIPAARRSRQIRGGFAKSRTARLITAAPLRARRSSLIRRADALVKLLDASATLATLDSNVYALTPRKSSSKALFQPITLCCSTAGNAGARRRAKRDRLDGLIVRG